MAVEDTPSACTNCDIIINGGTPFIDPAPGRRLCPSCAITRVGFTRFVAEALPLLPSSMLVEMGLEVEDTDLGNMVQGTIITDANVGMLVRGDVMNPVSRRKCVYGSSYHDLTRTYIFKSFSVSWKGLCIHTQTRAGMGWSAGAGELKFLRHA